jgi:hypothetical protein
MHLVFVDHAILGKAAVNRIANNLAISTHIVVTYAAVKAFAT